jgi:hypothetical protein
MPCLFAVFAGFFPRLADIFLWIARPTLFTAPFNGNWFWPLLGIIFLPFTTLFYVLMWTPGVGLVGWDWLWIGMAVVMDISSLAGHYRQYQDRLPASVGGTGAPA